MFSGKINYFYGHFQLLFVCLPEGNCFVVSNSLFAIPRDRGWSFRFVRLKPPKDTPFCFRLSSLIWLYGSAIDTFFRGNEQQFTSYFDVHQDGFLPMAYMSAAIYWNQVAQMSEWHGSSRRTCRRLAESSEMRETLVQWSEDRPRLKFLISLGISGS